MQRIEDEVVSLRARVQELEALLGWHTEFPLFLKLTKQEARVFGMLCKRDVMSRAGAMTAFYAHVWGREADVDPKIVDVIICKLRKKLDPYSIEIETIHGVGYRMLPAARQAAHSLIASQTQAA